MTPVLQASDLTIAYGGVIALDSVDLSVAAGELVGLVGANGAGKSTLLSCLSGHVRPDRGAVCFEGRDVTRVGPDRRAHLGLIRSFQDGRLFPTLSVRDTLLLAEERSIPTPLIPALFAVPPWLSGERRRTAAALRLADAMGLSPYIERQIGELSTGVRRVLDLACAVALRPRVLLLDEPSAGLASAEAAVVPGLLRQVQRDTDATILIVEHDLPLVFGLATRIVVIEGGRVVADGAPADVRGNPAVSFGFA